MKQTSFDIHLLADVSNLGFDVVAFDWRTPLAETWQALDLPAVQGNLDPIVLCADRDTVERQARQVRIVTVKEKYALAEPIDGIRVRRGDYVHL